MTQITLTRTTLHNGHNCFVIGWTDGQTRCHVWASATGQIDDTVHRNTPTGETYVSGAAKWKHRTGSLRARCYEPIRQQIAKLTAADWQAATERLREKEEADEARRTAEQNAREITLLFELAAKHGFRVEAAKAAA